MVSGLDFNIHSAAHVYRAVQEGIAFSFKYGMEIMEGLGMKASRISAGRANLFMSPLFRSTLSSLTGAEINLYNTDGAAGAARGAGIGAGVYASPEEAFSSLEVLEKVYPRENQALADTYREWKDKLTTIL